jgi:hypothetical protein
VSRGTSHAERDQLRIINKFIRALMEPDPELRAKLLGQTLASGADLEIDRHVFDSVPALSLSIDQQLHDSDYAAVGAGRPRKERSDGWTFRLRTGKRGRDREIKMSAAVDSEGKIERLSTLYSGELPPRTSEAVVRWMRDNVLVALALLAGVAYVLVRIPLVIFYSKLGTTPDEVGLGTEDVVRQSVLILGGIAAICILYMLATLVALYFFLGEVQVAHRARELEGRTIGSIAGAILIVGYLVFTACLLLAATEVVSTVFLWGMSAIVIALIVCRLLPGLRTSRGAVRERLRRVRAFSVAEFAPVVSLVVLVWLALLLPAFSAITAEQVQKGGSVSFPLLVWTARPVEAVDGKLPTDIRADDSCRFLRYLGASGQRVILYDTRLRRSVSVPNGDVTLTFPLSCRS